MDDVAHEAKHDRRGREARRAARAQRSGVSIPYITRNSPLVEFLNEEGLAIIERNAEILLEEIGIEFRDYPSALKRLTPGAILRANASIFHEVLPKS